jgi:hypothetical protein
MIPGHLLLAQRINDELAELEQSIKRINRAWQAAKRAKTEQDIYVDSVALNLHSFYSGFERLMEFTAYQLDGGPPKGPSWHKDLLQQMSTDLPGIRPPVITPDSADQLDEFRRFRHVVRNVYAEHLDPERIGKLVERLSATWRQLRAELEMFTQFLVGVSEADDNM